MSEKGSVRSALSSAEKTPELNMKNPGLKKSRPKVGIKFFFQHFRSNYSEGLVVNIVLVSVWFFAIIALVRGIGCKDNWFCWFVKDWMVGFAMIALVRSQADIGFVRFFSGY